MTAPVGTDSEAAAQGSGPCGAAELLGILAREAPLADRLRHLLLACEGRGLAAADLAQLLSGLMAAEARARAALSAQVQKAQFEAQHLRHAAASPPERLGGDARAIGLLLAEALRALPDARQAALFDAQAYLAANGDVAAAGVDPLAHYLASGAAEGRRPRDLGAYAPGAYANDPRPATLAALGQVTRPGFVTEFPPALRAAALDAAGRDGRTISVVMPTWNRAHVICPAVSSALLQSRAPCEVIVVDDGSTDGTAARLRARFPEPLAEGRLVLIESPHAGVAAARNAGLAAARGEIIAYLDSDNTWEPDHLLFACTGLTGGADAAAPPPAMAYTALCRHNMTHGWSDILFRRFDRAALEAENYIDLNSLVHSRALYEAQGGFDPALTRFVDWDLVLRYSAAAPGASPAASPAPAAIPVLTGHYYIGGAGGQDSITAREAAEPNLARIRAKLAGTP
ncbi:glycosyltransferase family 2 protein [Puniceibacterium confluentis]|uniref:glycosyltransferase family 2 protein n=1 Tax=Puniceibacterium confluentis TaxID=1958944 RepID=UPI001FE603BD|nr:glycosyltransferase family A protein [Puniceibacterium confluentis]